MTVYHGTFEERLKQAGFIKADPPRPALAPVVALPPTDLTDPAAERYLATAVSNEVGRVLNAVEGSRNDTLNTAAFSLGQLVAGAGLDRAHVEQQLAVAAHTVGLEDTETRNTITSGITAGMNEPRGIPELHITDPVGFPAFEVDPDAVTAHVLEHLPIIDWEALWADESEEEWIVEPLLPARRLVALYSAPKVGKSLLMLELAAAVAMGATVLGVTPDRERRVLYVDFENDPRADIRERLVAMGLKPRDLANLKYLSFPTMGALDSERGGRELMAAVRVYGCEVVVVDTVSRAIAGEENENDTWLAFYRHTGLKLKQAGVALVRLDHSGKDETKGQRGGSAKSGDVDAVWRLSKVTETTYRLDCEAARMPVAEKTLVLHREATPHLHHKVDAVGRSAAWQAKVDACIATLDELGVAVDAGRDTARGALAETGFKGRHDVVHEAQRQRRLRGAVHVFDNGE